MKTKITLRENALNSQPTGSMTARPIKMRLRVRKVVKKVNVKNVMTNQIDEPVYEAKTKGKMRLRLKMTF